MCDIPSKLKPQGENKSQKTKRKTVVREIFKSEMGCKWTFSVMAGLKSEHFSTVMEGFFYSVLRSYSW